MRIDCHAQVNNVSLRQGTAIATGLGEATCDLVLERAVIHHLEAYDQNCAERCLRLQMQTE